MAFNSLQYIVFLLIMLVVYYLIPRKIKIIRNIWLLAGSYYFYMQWNAKYALLILFSTIMTYVSGRIIAKYNSQTVSAPESSSDAKSKHNIEESSNTQTYKGSKSNIKRKSALVLCVTISLLLLGFFKYSTMIMSYAGAILSKVGVSGLPTFEWVILPVGISFFTLQSMGYVIDVYRGDVEAEKDFIYYALFVSFFPQLVAGPIERSGNLLSQFKEDHRMSFEQLKKGILLVLYGLFLKMVIADGAAVIVDAVYADYEKYTGMFVIVGTVFFLIQLYCDFYGYSTIARGSAYLLGIRLMDNFEAPFYSMSIKEFWRRWHVSLTGWFRDYLYIPLGGNRKGFIRGNINLMIVFLVSGLWHGASISFVIWGGLNGLYQVISNIWNKKIKHIFSFVEQQSENEKQIVNPSFATRLLKRFITFGLVTFTMLFFRAGQFKTALEMIKNMISTCNPDILLNDSLYELGMSQNHFTILVLAIVVMFIVDYFKYKKIDILSSVLSQPYWFRLLVFLTLFMAIILCGCYGSAYDIHQFVYFQF